MDNEQLDRMVENILKTVLTEIMQKLPGIVKETVYRQLEQVYKVQEDIRNDLGSIRDDFRNFDKRLSDLEILADTINSRTTQIKVTQDKSPKDMQNHVTNAVNNAVAESVPAAVLSSVEPRKNHLQAVRKNFFTRLFNH